MLTASQIPEDILDSFCWSLSSGCGAFVSNSEAILAADLLFSALQACGWVFSHSSSGFRNPDAWGRFESGLKKIGKAKPKHKTAKKLSITITASGKGFAKPPKILG